VRKEGERERKGKERKGRREVFKERKK